MAKRDPEEWTDLDLDRLLDRAFSSLDEALTCRKAGAVPAAMAMLAGAFEGALLAAVVAGQDELGAAGQPQPCPSRLHLPDLVVVARRAKWLSDPISDEVVQILNTARTMAVHPGAFVRGTRQIPDDDYDLADPVGFDVVYDLVARASEHLARATAATSGKTAPDCDA